VNRGYENNEKDMNHIMKKVGERGRMGEGEKIRWRGSLIRANPW
jgi:hypothetical protein